MKRQSTPYFTFDGNAREALEYYEEVCDGEVHGNQTFGEADFQLRLKLKTESCMHNLKRWAIHNEV